MKQAADLPLLIGKHDLQCHGFGGKVGDTVDPRLRGGGGGLGVAAGGRVDTGCCGCGCRSSRASRVVGSGAVLGEERLGVFGRHFG